MTASRSEIAEMIRSRGYRATLQRITIYEAVWRAGSHPTIADIHRYVKDSDPSISLATIYNTIHLFQEIGLVESIAVPGDSARFDPNTHPHINLVCKGCGKVQDYECSSLSSIAEEIERETGFTVISRTLEIRGLCAECKLAGKTTE